MKGYLTQSISASLRSLIRQLGEKISALRKSYNSKSLWEEVDDILNQVSELLIDGRDRGLFRLADSHLATLEKIEDDVTSIKGSLITIQDLIHESSNTPKLKFQFDFGPTVARTIKELTELRRLLEKLVSA